MKTQTIIFDVDGTIVDVEHRRHFVTTTPRDWKSFNDHTKFDTRVDWVCDIAKAFHTAGHRVVFFTARKDAQRDITTKQIQDFIGIDKPTIHMRADSDFRCDSITKADMADAFDGTIDLVFDDRQKVVDMWRAKGIQVIQVADGDF